MILATHIARYRGIRDLTIDGFGRVNLVIGRNDCGKTALMEALQLADDPDNAARILLTHQRLRLGRSSRAPDFEQLCRPLFYAFDAQTGFSIWVSRMDGIRNTIDVREGIVPEGIALDVGNGSGHRRGEDIYESSDATSFASWALDVKITRNNHDSMLQRIIGTPTGIRFSPPAKKLAHAWITSRSDIGEQEIKNVSLLRQRGEEGALSELLREVDDRLSGIELLAPGGEVAELFVRLSNGTPMLPITLMGEGFQRSFEIGAAAAAHDWPTLFIDEIENGMHHLVLEPLWRWIAKMSTRHNLQVFATTHSEECIHAASRAFHELDDKGLRVIRLDRTTSGTRAVVYDQGLVEIAERTGTEIRG